MTKDEALRMALEALEGADMIDCDMREAITALREALAEQPAQQDSTCNNTLRAQGKAYPRTCKKCGLGPCVGLAQQALDKKAENARELGLDYEQAQQAPVAWGVFEVNLHDMFFTEAEAVEMAQLKGNHAEVKPLYTAPQRTWVDLSDEEIETLIHRFDGDPHTLLDEVNARLKDKNT